MIGGGESRAIVKPALERGINFFDTRDFYSIGESEDILGQAVTRAPQRNSARHTIAFSVPSVRQTAHRRFVISFMSTWLSMSTGTKNTDRARR
jgi:predicted aldo/keto reductase-like oxidoreductase